MDSEIRKLELANQELLNSDDIPVLENQETVYRSGSTNNPKQTLPFSRLLLPLAFTGILKPHKMVDETHKAIQIMLPGTGTTFSVAETLCDIAGTFHGRKSKNRGIKRQADRCVSNQNKKFRVASFPADLPLNGMASDSPFEFASERGIIAMIRHVHLVLRKLYPNLPIFISGRSTGGAAAISYAQHYDDISGVIAINPPYPDSELLQYTIKYMEDRANTLDELLNATGIALHPDSWNAFKIFMPLFSYTRRPSLSPTLILISSNDPLNFYPYYAQALQNFANENNNRTIQIINADNNNLWDRKLVDTYHEVVSSQFQFISHQLDLSNSMDIK